MTEFTIASFNVKNLIGPDQEYYRFERYTPEEYAWKEDWLADQVITMDADIVGFQEIFDETALDAVMAEADARGMAANQDVLPDRAKRYARKAIFRKLAYTPYGPAGRAFAPNTNDGGPGERRPGLATISRLGFADDPVIIQELDTPLIIPMPDEDAGHFALGRTSRPILRVRVPVGEHVITIFNTHLKSKLGEFDLPPGADFPPEADLTAYDPVGRAIGSLRAALRRMAEAVVLRQLVVAALDAGEPVIVLGDLNDGESAVSSEIISGERPFRNYAWMRRHDAKRANERYSDEENAQIRGRIDALRLYSAERLFVRRSLRDMVYTSAFGGVYQSIDQILMSRHFHPDNPARIAEMDYFSTFNDHITDGSHAEAPYNKLASDHGQIMAHLRMV